MRTLSLSRVLDRAVQYALLSGLVGCVAQSASKDDSADSQDDLSETNEAADDIASMPDKRTPDARTPDARTKDASNSATDVTSTDTVEPLPAAADAAVPHAAVRDAAGRDTDFEPLLCEQQQPWNFANMNFTREVDFIAARTVTNIEDGMTQLASYGQACAGADAGACAAALAAAVPQTDTEWRSCSQLCSYYALVTTEASEVELLQTRSAVKELLGEIDSIDEAALWLQVNNREVYCGNSGQTTARGYEISHGLTLSLCPVQGAIVVERVSADGTIEELSREVQPETGACVGRRPEGLIAPLRLDTGHSVGDYFAEVARLEAAAVVAFDAIHAELVAFGAPQVLQQQARAAQKDEVRHARQMDALARRYGGTPNYPALTVHPIRSLFAAARDNLVEGCVRETFGAACAKYQADNARDPEVRRVLTQIAADETRHAELSWALNDWFVTQLDAEQCAQLERARHGALAQLRVDCTQAVPAAVRTFAGVPSPQHARALIDALSAELWPITAAA